MLSKKKKVVLLDAHAIIHRAYHALPALVSPKGFPAGALYGLGAMLLRIVKDLNPDYLIACYDLPEKTFRHEAYVGYKATRKKIPEDLIFQLEKSREIFHVFNIPIYDKPGFEADDIIGTIVSKLKNEKNLEIIIASGDLDTLQLVGQNIKVYTLKKGINETILYDEEKVKKRFGFEPKYLVDYKGLRGDPSDNIIGVRGIGEKTATTLITKFGTIEEIYEKLKKDEKAFKEAGLSLKIIDQLKAEEEEALFSKTLAQIKTDVPLEFYLPGRSWKENIDVEKIENFFQELGFRSLIPRLKEIFQLTKKPKVKVDPGEVEKIALALWLLNSKITNPSLEDILVYGGNSFAEAKARILKEIKENNLEYVYKEIELPLLPIVKKMEERGILIDRPLLGQLKQEYQAKLKEIESQVWQMVGHQFNLASPKQLAEVLFEELNLSTKGVRKTATQKRSTDINTLEKLKNSHPVIPEIINYRETAKILQTYLEPLEDLLDKEGRVHTHFIQSGTTTGRFSSEKPNLQNIPIQGRGREVRKIFIATPGYKLVAFDYSQIELRVAALLSQDQNLIEIFKSDKDVHNEVAAQVFKVSPAEVTPEMRRRAKVINFGILYGMGISALKTNLATTEAEARKFYANYLAAFPRLAQFLEETKVKAFNDGYTETLFGRRRYFPELRSNVPYIRAEAERQVINAPIQGTATADIIKLAMKEVSRFTEFDAFLLLQVHDELIFEVKEKEVKKFVPVIKKTMENVIPLEFLKGKTPVPLLVSVKSGNNWGELE